MEKLRGLGVHRQCAGTYMEGGASLQGATHPPTRRFRRLFEGLPPLYLDPAILSSLGEVGGPMDAGSTSKTGNMPAGFVFFGQFVDHDITLDVTSSFDRVNDPDAIRNFRTPSFDLDCVYGAGPEASPELYADDEVITNGNVQQPYLVDVAKKVAVKDDLARNGNGTALIGDPRNDENRIVSQVQHLFILFHNKLVDLASKAGVPEEERFEVVQRLARWHYQWVIVRDFLPRICGDDVVRDILANGTKLYRPTADTGVFMPVEFSVAAYRFGHSQVPGTLDFNKTHRSVRLFGKELGGGFTPKSSALGPIDWDDFFGSRAQSAQELDTLLASTLLDLPFLPKSTPTELRSLAIRNLFRGQAFGLPSGQQVHAYVEAATGVTTKMPNIGNKLGKLPRAYKDVLEDATPLWFWILAEAKDVGKGDTLGPVGGRIVAETMLGIMFHDSTAFLGTNRAWVPWVNEEFPKLVIDPGKHSFDMEDLVAFAAN